MKKTCAFLLALVMLLACTGCSVLMDVNTSIRKNGSGTITVALGVDSELYNAIAQSGDSSYGTMVPMTIGETDAFGESKVISFDSYKELNGIMTGDVDLDELSLGSLFSAFEASRKGIKATVNGDMFADSFSGVEEYGIAFHPTYTFTFEKKVKEANGKITDDGHTVIYNALSTGEIDIRLKQSPLPIILIIVGVIAVAVVVFLIVKNKKSKQPTDAAGCVNDEISTPVETATADESIAPDVAPAVEAAEQCDEPKSESGSEQA